MSEESDYDLEREANIARNRALLAALDITSDLPPTKKQAKSARNSAKPVQSAKRTKRERDSPVPVRQSARLRRTVKDPNETPAQKRKREKEDEERRAKEEEERLEAEEQARQAKRPRHCDLDLQEITDSLDLESDELTTLRKAFSTAISTVHAKRMGDVDDGLYDGDAQNKVATAELREKLGNLVVVARAKVARERIYSAAYHPDATKDLIFFGDKHGALGIWDARAPRDETEDGEESGPSDDGSGKTWKLQLHWPATSHSSISHIKFDPVDAHSVFTSSYDCTVRKLSFTSGISTEVFSLEDSLITSIDLPLTGNEMWISDSDGGITHLDLREDRSKARWYQVSEQKVGSVSINPTTPHYLVTASNSRAMRIWDIRKLQNIQRGSKNESEYPNDFDVINEHLESPKGKGCLRAEWRHGKSVSAAYWDPRGRSIVSTSYDDLLRVWDFKSSVLKSGSAFPSSRPSHEAKHNCQTGKWVSVFRAQWSPNPDCYPHFTVGNMNHSLDIYSETGELVARLADKQKISAVQAVTCSHPNVLERAASGNASGRCVLWGPSDL
ncbi:WD40-repeat-containing domain protein [Fomitopsis betulina]|nr:WD40-repeat-containing domain protein [Fomitopsis betulina]